MLVGIVAIAENYAIGKDGKLPWHYSADLKFFRRTTIKHTVVMGYNTWESIGKPLPKRLNVVLSRSKSIEYQERVITLRNVGDALALSEYVVGDMFVIGGASIYAAFGPYIDRWIVTHIPKTVDDADVFMPENFLLGFSESTSEDIGDGLTAKTYDRDK